MVNLYYNLLKACQEKGVTISKACQDLGYPKSTGTALKQGQMSMGSDKLLAFADYLGVSVDVLLGRTEEKPCDLHEELKKLRSKLNTTEVLYKTTVIGEAQKRVANDYFRLLDATLAMLMKEYSEGEK